jgi:hypothetical protein
MVFTLKLANHDDAEKWDAIISQSPHGTLFHTWRWLKIAEKHTQMKLFPLIGLKGSTPIGIFPLFFKKTGLLRLVFSPPPHTSLPYLGPVFVGYDRLNQEKRENNYIEFQKSVDFFIKNDLKAHYILISLPPALQDPRPFIWSGYRFEPHFDYVIDLSIGLDSLLKTLSPKQRQNLNRAYKRGITVEVGGRTEYQRIIDLMDFRYTQQAMKNMVSKQYLLDIYDAYKENMKIFVAKIDGEIVTGSIDICYKDTHYSWIGNPKPKNRIAPSPNNLLVWESVRYAYEQGFRYYITMNAAGDNRLHTYYASKFDPELKVHFSVKKNSFQIGIIEKGYTALIKPIKGMQTYNFIFK